MKRCIKEHVVDAFGPIPVGSLWADDSPYITDESLFVDADQSVEADDEPAPVKRPAVKKSAARKES